MPLPRGAGVEHLETLDQKESEAVDDSAGAARRVDAADAARTRNSACARQRRYFGVMSVSEELQNGDCWAI